MLWVSRCDCDCGPENYIVDMSDRTIIAMNDEEKTALGRMVGESYLVELDAFPPGPVVSVADWIEESGV